MERVGLYEDAVLGVFVQVWNLEMKLPCRNWEVAKVITQGDGVISGFAATHAVADCEVGIF